jgi:Tol biopolymer transport system component/DNA-binding winged helix-turn-helix (wHTH) protein
VPGVEQQQSSFQFGVFQLDPRSGELRKHGVRLKLQDQPLRILTLLLEHAGEVVAREDIQRRLWADNTYVDFDNAINSAVRKLREALADSPENPRFIETVTRRGYRFIAPVSRPTTDQPTRLASPSSHEGFPLVDSPTKVANNKRRVWWSTVGLITVLVAGIVLLRWWVQKSDQASQEPLPAVPLTGNSGYETYPTFSPEGTRVAFSWQQPGKHGANIYVKLIGPGDPVRLTKDPHRDFGPAWSPDGRYIAFLRATDPYHAAVMIIPAVGGKERQLAGVTFDVNDCLMDCKVPPPFLAWSADAGSLLSLDQKAPNETYSIVRISVETGEKRILTSPPVQTNGDGSLAPSRDGKTLAFTRTLGLESDIYVASLSQDATSIGEPSRLTFDSREIDGLSWSADGRSLVFSSNRSGRRELWQIAAKADSKPARLTAAGDDPRNVVVSREGRHLVYSHNVFDSDVWRISLSGKSQEEAQNFISSTRIEFHAKYSPDGKRIAFESNRSGNNEIWISDANGSNPVQLTAFRNAWAGSPRWSPDGRKITFDCNAAGTWDIYVISSQGGKSTRLTTNEANEFRPSWSHDGNWIYYCSTRTGHGQVWKLPANGGAEVQVTRRGGYIAFESLSGEDLYYTKEHELWKTPVRGGDEVRVLKSPAEIYFAPAKRGIYFLEDTQSFDNTLSLKFLDYTTHAIKTIAAIPGPFADDEISVSPDEQWMLYGKTGRGGSELMLIENFH